MKFKVGDPVVILRSGCDGMDGSLGLVETIDHDGFVKVSGIDDVWFCSDNIALSQLYFSPLYQALL